MGDEACRDAIRLSVSATARDWVAHNLHLVLIVFFPGPHEFSSRFSVVQISYVGALDRLMQPNHITTRISCMPET